MRKQVFDDFPTYRKEDVERFVTDEFARVTGNFKEKRPVRLPEITPWLSA